MECLDCGQKWAGGEDEQSRESLCPSELSRLLEDEVLTDLYLHDWNAPLLTMVDDGEIRDITGGVGLVAPHHEISFFAQEVQEWFCQASVSVGKNADVQRPKHV
jgi:hypothetical protein